MDFTGAPQKKRRPRLCGVKKHSKLTPDIKFIFVKRCNQFWNGFKCSEKCLKIQQHFRRAQFTQQSPESKKFLHIFFRNQISVCIPQNLESIEGNILGYSACWMYVKGTLSQFGKIARRGAALGRKHKALQEEVQAGEGARRPTAWGRCSTASSPRSCAVHLLTTSDFFPHQAQAPETTLPNLPTSLPSGLLYSGAAVLFGG